MFDLLAFRLAVAAPLGLGASIHDGALAATVAARSCGRTRWCSR